MSECCSSSRRRHTSWPRDWSSDVCSSDLSIVVQGTSQGVATDPDGGYTLNVAEDAILVFSYIGYERREMAVEGRSQIAVAMETMAIRGSELVGVGKGTQRREVRSSSVSTGRADELRQG